MPSVVRKRKSRSDRDNFEDEPGDANLEMDELGAEMRHYFDEEDDDERNDKANDVAPMPSNGRLRLRPEIALDGPQYLGRKSSRQDAFADSESEESESAEPSDSATELLRSSGKLEFDDISSEEGSQLGPQAAQGRDEELEALSREYDELRKQEEVMLRNLKTDHSDDVQKGLSVRNQKALWDRGLEYRISLQKILSGANRLPVGEAKQAFCKDTAVEEAYSALINSALQTCDVLLDLQKAIIEQNPSIADAHTRSQSENKMQENGPSAASSPSVSPCENAWDRMTSLYSRMVPYRNSSLDRWQRKTQLSTGQATSKLKLRAFNQSIAEQVAAIMRDPSRIMSRMRVRSSAVHVFGQVKPGVYTTGETIATEQQRDDGDCESFDDSEFYQQLLQEFFESSVNGRGDFNPHAIRKLRNKKRKVVDRRASKGRKIRYNVFDSLVNFCAPEPMVLPPMTSKLFANLFGQTKKNQQ